MVRKLVGLMSAFCLMATLVLVGGSRPASANSNCDQTNPMADVVASQSVAIVSAGVQFHVTLTNLGPCTVPDVSFDDSAPAPITAVSTNPSGWRCTLASATDVRCAPTSTMGVPGTVDIYITTGMPTGDPTNVATATVGGGATACTDGSAATTCDPSPDNNTSFGGLVTATSTNRTIHTPRAGQWTEVAVGAGAQLAAQIQQLSVTCPAALPTCFGQLVSIAASNAAPQTKTFVYPISIVPSYGSATIARLDTTSNTWVVPPPCKGTPLPDPCLQTKERVKIAGVTYLRFVVVTTQDDSWMGE